MRRSSGSTQNTSWMADLLTLSMRVSPGHLNPFPQLMTTGQGWNVVTFWPSSLFTVIDQHNIHITANPLIPRLLNKTLDYLNFFI